MSTPIALNSNPRFFGQLQSPDEPGCEPPESMADEDLLAEDAEFGPASYLEPRRIRMPRFVVWAILILFGLIVIAAGIWGFARSTLTYGMIPMDATTSARLAQIHAKLAAIGAPEAALRHLAVAAQPGINIGNAIEALADADKALESMSDNPTAASARQEIRAILNDLSNRRYGPWQLTPSVNVSPLPTLLVP